jgi:hypothetical protein
MSQHFLLSPAARTLSLAGIMRMTIKWLSILSSRFGSRRTAAIRSVALRHPANFAALGLYLEFSPYRIMKEAARVYVRCIGDAQRCSTFCAMATRSSSPASTVRHVSLKGYGR